jgi:hypothetical protein
MTPNPGTVRNTALVLWGMTPAAQGDVLAKIAAAVGNDMMARHQMPAEDAAEFAEKFVKHVAAEMLAMHADQDVH